MPFAATLMDLVIVILSKPDRERHIIWYHKESSIIWYHLYVESKIKKAQMNLFPKQKETQRHRKQTFGYQKEKGTG